MLPVGDFVGGTKMTETDSSIAQQLAQAASRFQKERTGQVPTAMTVMLGDDTLVITLQNALPEIQQTVMVFKKRLQPPQPSFTDGNDGRDLDVLARSVRWP